MTALVLGAGGAARAAVYALRSAGRRRRAWSGIGRRERAERLVAELGGRVVAAPERASLVVNCTSVGLRETDRHVQEPADPRRYVRRRKLRGGHGLQARWHRAPRRSEAAGGDGGDGPGDPGRTRRSVVRALDRHDGIARGDARRRRRQSPTPMNPPTQAGAPPKPAQGKPKKGNGITTPSRRGGSGRVLTDVIVDLGFVEREAMDEAVEMAHSAGSAAERVLVSTGAITEAQLARAVAERFGLDHLDLQVYRVDPDAAKLVTPAAIKRYQAVPVAFAGRPHAARRDGRPGERARGRRHRGDDRLRGAPRGRLAVGHRVGARAHRRPELGKRRRRRARARPARRRALRGAARATAAGRSTTSRRRPSTSAPPARTPRSSSSCSG